jgi:hypothetical protein
MLQCYMLANFYMHVQLENAVKIARFMFPKAIIHWVFDLKYEVSHCNVGR